MYVYPVKPDEIFHYGMPRRSGRYPYGSGDRPYQSEGGRINTDTIRIRNLDRKIEKAKKSKSKNVDIRAIERRRDRIVNRDLNTRSDDPYTRKIAKVQRAKENAHVYTKVRTGTRVAGEVGVIAMQAAIGNLGGVALSAAFTAIDFATEKIVHRSIEKAGNKIIRNISSKYTKEYEDNVLRSLKTNPEEAKRLVREQTEKQYRILGFDSDIIRNHDWDKKTAEKVFQELVDGVTNDMMELLSGKTDDEIRKEKYLRHSAKGSEWEDHKYVKKIDGVYYYPVGYEDGRTIDSLKGENDSDKSFQIEEVKKHFDQYLAKRGIDWRTLPKDEVDQMQRDIVKQLESGKETGTEEKTIDELAKDVVSGKFGNGEDQKALLGEKYSEVQKKVNDILKGSSGDKKVSEEAVSEEIKETVKKSATKVSETKVHSGVNLSEVLSVYEKK